MEDNLITLETAELAREKGCDISFLTLLDWTYVNENGDTITCNYDPREKQPDAVPETGCTQSLMQKWLREKHFLWVEITVFGDGIGTMCIIKKADPNDREDDNSRIVRMSKSVDTGLHARLEFDYVKTLEKGLQEALKLIEL